MHPGRVTRPIVVLEAGSPEERAAYVEALTARGLTVMEGPVAGDAVTVAEDEGAITVRGPDLFEPEVRLSRTIAATDLAAFVRLASEVSELHGHLRRVEDFESVGLSVSIVAHDANNALAPMMFAADELVAMNAAPITELAESIREGCRRLLTMLRHLMAMTRGSGPQVVSVNTVLASLAGTLRMLAGRKVQLTTRFEDPLPPVLIDPLDLERVILNLVANARDAMPDGGDMLLSTSGVYVVPGDASNVPEGRWVLIELRDRGIGMDLDTLARAFEPFFTTKPAGHGTGLGLASVKRAIRAASGEVRIHSLVGKGTVVEVWLPASTPR